MTSTASARRGTHQAGSRTWVVRHERHRARAGCSITGRPPGPRTVRRRPVPHRRNRAEHRGHANRPAARSATARSSSATTITPEVSIHACKPYPARDCGARGELVLRPARSDCPHPTVATPSRPADTLTRISTQLIRRKGQAPHWLGCEGSRGRLDRVAGLRSGEFEVEAVVVPPGDGGVGGEVGLA